VRGRRWFLGFVLAAALFVSGCTSDNGGGEAPSQTGTAENSVSLPASCPDETLVSRAAAAIPEIAEQDFVMLALEDPEGADELTCGYLTDGDPPFLMATLVFHGSPQPANLEPGQEGTSRLDGVDDISGGFINYDTESDGYCSLQTPTAFFDVRAVGSPFPANDPLCQLLVGIHQAL
jgi:hypothetical protein